VFPRLVLPVFALGVLVGCSNSVAPGGGGGFATPDILFPDVQVTKDTGGSELGPDSQQQADIAGSDVGADPTDVAAATDAASLTDAVAATDSLVADIAAVDVEADLPDFGNFLMTQKNLPTPARLPVAARAPFCAKARPPRPATARAA
jgi:hypothetical protein